MLFPSRHWHSYLYESTLATRASHMAISLSRFHCACQRFEEMTAKDYSSTIVLCELDYQSIECYCTRDKEIMESQREMEGGLEQV